MNSQPTASTDPTHVGSADGGRRRLHRALAGWTHWRSEVTPAVPAAPSDACVGYRRGGGPGAAAVVAEASGGYDTDEVAGDPGAVGVDPDAVADGTPAADSTPAAPLGVAVLGELPDFAAALEALVASDRMALGAVAGLAELLDSGQVESTTGLSVEQWLGIVARQTRMDRRLLLRLCRLLGRFPALAAGVKAGQVSFAQLRGLGIALKAAPTVIDGELNGLLARLCGQLEGADPDVIVGQVRQAIVELSPPAVADADPTTNRLWLQPNLDATGGRFGGQLNSLGLAILDAATAPERSQRSMPGGTEAARAHNLLTRLTRPCHHPDPCTCTTSTDAADPDADDDGRDGRDDDLSGDRGDADDGRLDLDLDGVLDGDLDGQDAVTVGGRDGEAARRERVLAQLAGLFARDRAGEQVTQVGCLAPPKLLLRAELATLLDGERMPVALLTRLTGGQLRLSSEAARRLLDARGAELRTIIVDQGQVAGVGRSSRQPPGWLGELVQSVHDTCTGPLCDRPALGADLDHAIPWWPETPDGAYGTTDAFNLGPLCSTTNQRRHLTGWSVVQHPDGRRTWTHRRTGVSITSVPATWRPAGWDPTRDRPPDTSGPPDDSGPPGTGPPDGPRPGEAGGLLPSPEPPDDLPF
jgi:hypothetical protein